MMSILLRVPEHFIISKSVPENLVADAAAAAPGA
jgi:hypothetical protein